MSIMFCDSNCELMYNKLQELNIKGIQMPYTLNGEMSYYDFGEKTDMNNFFNGIKSGVVAKTQALNSQDYINYFEPILKSGEDIIYVHFSSEMSGTFNYMNTAIEELKEKYPQRKITTCDTLSISMGAGLIVLNAAKMHNNGYSDEQIKEWVEQNRHNFSIVFALDDLNYLKQSGRLKASTAFFGSILGIKPICRVSLDGKIENFNKVSGRKKAILYLVDYIKNNAYINNENPLIILNADCENEADFLENELIKDLGNINVIKQSVGPVIASHCGPNVIGVAFKNK